MNSKAVLRTTLAIVSVFILIFLGFNIAMTTSDVDTSVFATSATLP